MDFALDSLKSNFSKTQILQSLSLAPLSSFFRLIDLLKSTPKGITCGAFRIAQLQRRICQRQSYINFSIKLKGSYKEESPN